MATQDWPSWGQSWGRSWGNSWGPIFQDLGAGGPAQPYKDRKSSRDWLKKYAKDWYQLRKLEQETLENNKLRKLVKSVKDYEDRKLDINQLELQSQRLIAEMALNEQALIQFEIDKILKQIQKFITDEVEAEQTLLLYLDNRRATLAQFMQNLRSIKP